MSRASGLSLSQINRLEAGIRGVGSGTIDGLARAFAMEADEVFRVLTGLKASNSKEGETIKQILYAASDLSEEEQEEVLEYINLRLRLSHERGQDRDAQKNRRKAATIR